MAVIETYFHKHQQEHVPSSETTRCCAECGANGNTNLSNHHRLPQNLARRLGFRRRIYDVPENIVLLCRSCHDYADEESLANPIHFYLMLMEAFRNNPETQEEYVRMLERLPAAEDRIALLQRQGKI